MKSIEKKNQTKKNFQHNKIPCFKKGDLLYFEVFFWKSQNEQESKTRNGVLGLCLKRSNQGLQSTFTVKHIVNKIWTVETFPIYSPFVKNIKINKN